MSDAAELRLATPGAELSRGYYRDCGRPLLYERFGQYMDALTVGLVGEGSECFGFDDWLSMDHDYGLSFCIWLSDGLFDEIGGALSELYASLPQEYMGVRYAYRREQSAGRRGVIRTGDFYRKFLGTRTAPETPREWLAIPETYLAAATNGVLFHVPDTEFVRTREKLLAFYPEDVRRKKLAASLVRMAHAGQVNYFRMARREDAVAARLALDQFIEHAMCALYLLNRQYCPYYKWMWRGLEKLPRQAGLPALLRGLAAVGALDADAAEPLVDAVCTNIIALLHEQGLSELDDGYLERQAYAVTGGIADTAIRNLPVLMG